MIRRLRLMIVLIRPAVLILLGLFTAIGVAQAGRSQDGRLLAEALAVVIAFLLFSVACNDLADEAIDRINLVHAGRPLVAGTGRRRQLVVVAATSGIVALGVSAMLSRPALVVTTGGLILSANYSLRPVRLAARGALASLLLPACYVEVPYLVGIFAMRESVRASDLTLLAALYIGFIGRILLKDFRDVRGDALFGKRTFLVRHGRRATCRFSESCWMAGAILLVAVEHPSAAFVVSQCACLVAALAMIRALSSDRGVRRDEWLISGVAIVGRGMLVLLLAQLSMAQQHWATPAQEATIGALLLVTIGPAVTMVKHGPVERRRFARRVESLSTESHAGV